MLAAAVGAPGSHPCPPTSPCSPPPPPRPGIVAQHNAQPGSPLEQLSAHLADPWKNHFINNGVSLPFLTDRCAALGFCAHQLRVFVLASSALPHGPVRSCWLRMQLPSCAASAIWGLHACPLAALLQAPNLNIARQTSAALQPCTINLTLASRPPPSHPLQRAQPAGRQLLSSPLQPDAALSCG